MLPFFEVFPDRHLTELRTIFIPGDEGWELPVGTYAFTEYYCSDLACDCRRVMVKVYHIASPSPNPGPECSATEVATISYTWSPGVDSAWQKIIAEQPNPFLDPFHRQASFAVDLMELWYDMLCRDTAYADRIKRHYAELRQAVGQRGEPSRIDPPRVSDEIKSAAQRRRLRAQRKRKRKGNRRRSSPK